MTEQNSQPKLIREPVKKEDLNQYGEDRGRMARMVYVNATMDILPSLQHMLDTATSFKQLKKELSAFVQDRQEFVNYDKNNRPRIDLKR